ncbi:class I SAM-dependent methyltransferase [Synechococcus sp. AH-224-G16]|nr:class I SAM-dependent methyltransferase [Synechococcus sp. AH-224-G16]
MRSRIRRIHDFLEVGCGTGFVISGIARAFPELRLEATEYFEEGLVFARQRVPQCRFRQLDATAMEEENAYDCIGSFDVIEHIEADDTVLRNFYCALRNGGFLLLTVPQHPWLWSPSDDYAHHVRRYTAQELRRKVVQAGFQIEYCTSFISLLFPLMALQRILRRNQKYNPNDEFNISPLLNSLFYFVMRVELIFLKFGLRFPVGGSLVLLGRKL